MINTSAAVVPLSEYDTHGSGTDETLTYLLVWRYLPSSTEAVPEVT